MMVCIRSGGGCVSLAMACDGMVAVLCLGEDGRTLVVGLFGRGGSTQEAAVEAADAVGKLAGARFCQPASPFAFSAPLNHCL